MLILKIFKNKKKHYLSWRPPLSPISFCFSALQLLLFLSVPAAAKTAPPVTASTTNISFIFHLSLHQQLHLLPVSSITRQPSTTHSSLAQPKKKKRKNRLLCCDPPPSFSGNVEAHRRQRNNEGGRALQIN